MVINFDNLHNMKLYSSIKDAKMLFNKVTFLSTVDGQQFKTGSCFVKKLP